MRWACRDREAGPKLIRRSQIISIRKYQMMLRTAIANRRG